MSVDLNASSLNTSKLDQKKFSTYTLKNDYDHIKA
jgi:hypothetical protein